MTRTTPIRRHAITPPVFGREKLHRQRLVEILKANLDRRLILVIAPAGYGKTTLMADLTAHSDRPVCWVRVTEHDRDPARLWRVVVESLGAKFRRMRRQLDARGLESLPADKIGAWIGRQIGETGAPPFALMFDDVHLLGGSSESTALVAGLIDSLPEHVCCILGGREALELPLARAVAANEVLSIGAGDLSFAEDELEAWLKMDGGGEASAEMLERLMSESRGWIAGIQLLRLRGLEALHGSVPSPKELTFDYFGSEVLGRQSDALQRFALESSVLPVMTAEAVEAVCRVEDGARWLRLAVRRGLFLSGTSSSPRTYEYHPLFREFLQKRMEASDSKRARAAKIRAAKFLAKRGEAEQAVELFWEAELPYDALRVAEKAARKMRIEGRVDTLLRWNSLLRQKGISSSGILLRLSFLFGEMGRIGDAYRFWREGEKVEDPTGRHTMDFRLQRMRIDLVRGYSRAVIRSTRRLMRSAQFGRMRLRDRAEVMNMHANTLLESSGDLSEALWYSRRANYLVRKNDAFWRTGALLTYWACVAYAGNREEAVRCELDIERLSKLFISHGQRVAILNNLGWDAALDGRFEAALGLLDQAMLVAEDFGLGSDRTLVLVNLGELYSDAGRPREALNYYDAALRLSRVGADQSWIRFARLRKATALRRVGRYSLARREIRRLRRLKNDLWSSEIEIEFLALQALRVPRLALGKMMKLTKRPLGAAPRTILEVHIVRTMMTLGQRDDAKSRLKELLPMAKKSWAVLPLTGEMSAASDLRSLARTCADSAPTLYEVEAYMSRGMTLPSVPDEGRVPRVNTLPMNVQAFGELRITIFGQQLKIKRKALEFLLFVVDNDGVAQERATEEFWGHLPGESQSANLHSTVYALRRVLGRHGLLTRNGVIRLAPTLSVNYDVGDFSSSALIAEKRKGSFIERVAVLERAVRLYRGPFAPAITSEWAGARRTELQTTFVALCLDLAECCLGADCPSRAIPHVKRALLWEPYREDVAMALLQCLIRSGRAVEALHAGLKFSTLVQSDGVARPGPEFQALLWQLSTGRAMPEASTWLATNPR